MQDKLFKIIISTNGYEKVHDKSLSIQSTICTIFFYEKTKIYTSAEIFLEWKLQK